MKNAEQIKKEVKKIEYIKVQNKEVEAIRIKAETRFPGVLKKSVSTLDLFINKKDSRPNKATKTPV